MARVAFLLVLGCLAPAALSACETQRKGPPAPKARSQAVEGKSAPSSAAAPSATASAAPIPKRVLCDGQMTQPGRAIEQPKLTRKAAAGAPGLKEQLPLGGQWTWVNFWAAWCVPCKEEIPRLVAWERKLNAAGNSFQLAFVSLDDDERQLEAFLTSQPSDGLRSTWWLQQPEERGKWLARTGVGSDPELPAHLLVDPRGKVRCVIQGAVEDGDYERVRSLIAN
jgi:thiol-disulfide isomerase/thioredoxin